MNILIAPFVNAIFGFYYLVGNLGWSVVLVTVVIRLILMPLVVPSLKSAKKMNELQPKLKKLQQQYGKEKEKLAKAQMDLYKAEGFNPLSGCLPQILQVAVLIIFIISYNMVVGFSQGKSTVVQLNRQLIPSFQIKDNFKMKMTFFNDDLRLTLGNIFGKGINTDLILPVVLLLGSVLLQYFSSKLMMPAPKLDEKAVAQTKDKEDDMMSTMRTQSLYMMPFMTVVFGWNYALGILLYWFVNSAVMLGQQLVIGKMNKDK